MTESFVLAFVDGVTPSKWVGVWKQRMPRVPIELRPASNVDALELLRSGLATVALLRLPVDDPELSVIPLYVEQQVVVAAKDHPVASFESLTLAELSGEIVVEGQDAAAVELVAAAGGIALMPQSLARLHSRRDVVARPITDGETTQIGLVWPREATTALVEQFIGIVRGRTANSSRG